MYITLKYIHVISVMISIGLFLVRGYWLLNNSSILKTRVIRVAPHINDTVLLLSAIGLTIQVQQYPFTHAWLTAKVLALVVYIILGAIAITYGKTPTVRLLAFIGALLTVSYILLVASSHNPWPFG